MPKPAQPGDPLHLPASTWNALVDSLGQRPPGQPRPTLRHHNMVPTMSADGFQFRKYSPMYVVGYKSGLPQGDDVLVVSHWYGHPRETQNHIVIMAEPYRGPWKIHMAYAGPIAPALISGYEQHHMRVKPDPNGDTLIYAPEGTVHVDGVDAYGASNPSERIVAVHWPMPPRLYRIRQDAGTGNSPYLVDFTARGLRIYLRAAMTYTDENLLDLAYDAVGYYDELADLWRLIHWTTY